MDDLIVGTYFQGYLKIDHFNDLIESNALGGNNVDFSIPSSTGYYTSEVNCEMFNKNPCGLKINYNHTGTAELGGTSFIFGGGENGWMPIYKDLSAYNKLHIALKAEADSTNPGILEIELKNQDSLFSYQISGINTVYTEFDIPFPDFLPPITSPVPGEFTIVFRENVQQKLIGIVHVDEIEFRNSEYTGIDTISPSTPVNWLMNGNAVVNCFEISEGDTLSISFNEPSPRFESIRLEIRRDNLSYWEVYERKYAGGNSYEWVFDMSKLPNDNFLDLRAVVQNYSGFESSGEIIHAKTSALNLSVSELFQQSFELFQFLRNDLGVYRDAAQFSNYQYHPASIASIGMGLISLCIADSMNWISDASELAELTLKSMSGNNPPFEPVRNQAGYFPHFIDMETGGQAWDSEYSSIDNAILLSGAEFCKKYFSSNYNVGMYCDQLWSTIDWSASLANPETGAIYMILNEDSSGDTSSLTYPFNEYMIVAWLAKIAEDDSLGPAHILWDNFYAEPDSLPKSLYQGISVLTDSLGSFLSNFTIQFPYYLCNYFTNSAEYIEYMQNARLADSLWWKTETTGEPYEWGLGAGAAGYGSGYEANAIGNNPSRIFSPYIIAGFCPVYENGKNDLIQLLNDGKCVYGLPSEGLKKVLWRYSLSDPEWQATAIQGVDYSTMLFGLAGLPEHLGPDFFKTYNDFDLSLVNAIREHTSISCSNFPNPFSNSTTITIELKKPSQIHIDIIDIYGRIVYSISGEAKDAGKHSYTWFGNNESGQKVPGGVYFYYVKTDDYQSVRKIIFLN